MSRVLCNISCDLDPLDLGGQGQIMYFLVSTFPPKLMDITTSNFAGA